MSDKPKSNPFLLNADKAKGSNLSDLEDKGTELSSPLDQYEPGTNSLAEVATLDTTHITALRERADAVVHKTEKLVIHEAEGLREVLNFVDASMKDDVRLSGLDLVSVRDYVKSIMITLKAHPEFDDILLPEDVRNIVRFARESYLAAQDDMTLAQEKKASRAAKANSPSKKAKAAKTNAMANALKNLGGL